MTVAKETLAELSVPAGSTPSAVLAAVASAAAITDIIGVDSSTNSPSEFPVTILFAAGVKVDSSVNWVSKVWADNTVLAAAASAAVTTPTIGAVLDPVPPRVTGTVVAVISCPVMVK